ncbi:MAG TPA: 2OG-Fe(II) oxygenase [Acidimicrobiales bacterium]|nr:2OG-Fe(II) oxygenase [Acidimicrobiales bacterium]
MTPAHPAGTAGPGPNRVGTIAPGATSPTRFAAVPAGVPVAARVDRLDWAATVAGLDDLGSAIAGPVLTPAECRHIAGLYDAPDRFRSTVDMARHRFGEGEYRYFARPLPELVAARRAAFWPHLLPVARDWAGRLGSPAPWPDDLDDWLARCHDAGQTRPTPLLLRYGPGDWNALHRDLYGDLVFPLQVVIGLDRPGDDFTGGEFVTTEQRPRAQSRATAHQIGRGEALVFTTRDRPVRSARGWSAAPVRHGVSVVRSGRRRTLGLVFHDAR